MSSQPTTSKLQNGIERVAVPLTSPTTTLLLTVGEGLIHDSSDRIGERHLLEHLFFSPRDGQADTSLSSGAKIESMGGLYNAHIRKEHSSYWIDCLPEYTEEAICLLSALISDDVWSKEVIEKEYKIMEEEYALYHNNYPAVLSDKLDEALIEGPLGRSLFTNFSGFRVATPAEYSVLHKNHWGAVPLQIVIAGTFSNKDVETLDRVFCVLPRTVQTDTSSPEVSLWKSSVPKEIIFNHGTDVGESVIEWRFPLLELPPESDLILSQCLGALSSSRVADACRTKGVGYSLSASVTSYTHLSHLSIVATVPKSEEDELKKTVEESILSYIQNPLTEEEFKRACIALRAEIIRTSSTTLETAETIAHDFFLTSLVSSPTVRLQNIKSISFEQIRDALSSLSEKGGVCGILRY